MNTNTFITTIGTEVTVDQKLQTKPRGWTKEVVIMGVVLDSEGHSYTSPSEADFYSVFWVMTGGFKFWLEDFFQEDVAYLFAEKIKEALH